MSGDTKEQPNIFYTKEAPLLQAECLLNEGKVKSIYRMADEPEQVYIYFHDKVTAGNGRRVDFPEGKGKTCCLISALLFEMLEGRGLRTHYIDCPSLDTLLCKKLTIVPVEVIVRNIAAGSLVRQTTLEEGTLLNPPLVEYFLKDDAKDDPLLTPDRVGLMGIDPEPMKQAALNVNNHFQILFAQLGIDVVDLNWSLVMMLTAISAWLMNYHLTTCDSGKKVPRNVLTKTSSVKKKETLLQHINIYYRNYEGMSEMHGSLEPEENVWRQTEPTDMYDDMRRLNALYEELCWDHNDILDFIIEGDRIIIKNKTRHS